MPKLPPPLRPGDLIGVFAPASPVQAPMLADGVSELERRGYRVRMEGDITTRARYLAGEDGRRAAELETLMSDPAVRVLWAARGGYGTGRIVDRISLDALHADPRYVVGSSDLTALHLRLVREGLPALYGPMVASDSPGDRAGFDAVLELLEGRTATPGPARLADEDARIVCEGPPAEGVLVGGCLSLLAAACGTADALDAEGGIVLVEDVGERPYRVDRMLTQLRRSGCLDGARAVVLGQMPGCEHQADGQGYGLDDVLRDLLGDLGVPVVAGFPTGHVRGGTVHHPLPLGLAVRLEGERLLLAEAAVQVPPAAEPPRGT